MATKQRDAKPAFPSKPFPRSQARGCISHWDTWSGRLAPPGLGKSPEHVPEPQGCSCLCCPIPGRGDSFQHPRGTQQGPVPWTPSSCLGVHPICFNPLAAEHSGAVGASGSQDARARLVPFLLLAPPSSPPAAAHCEFQPSPQMQLVNLLIFQL